MGRALEASGAWSSLASDSWPRAQVNALNQDRLFARVRLDVLDKAGEGSAARGGFGSSGGTELPSASPSCMSPVLAVVSATTPTSGGGP